MCPKVRQTFGALFLISVALLPLMCLGRILVRRRGEGTNAPSNPGSKMTLQNPASAKADREDKSLIEPGKRVGQLKLGDTRERALQLFQPKANTDEEISTDNCGLEYIWLDSQSRPQGNVSIRFQNSVVFQIESGTPRFHTVEGIKAYDRPDEVRAHYPGLRAYALVGSSPMSFGGGSLIYWVDWTKGIAFFFASTRRDHERYLYSIIVFEPGGRFCPEREDVDSPTWRELAPYALEVPNETALSTPRLSPLEPME